MHVSIQIIIAALSVLGFYFSLRTVASLIFASKQISASVVIESKKQLLSIDVLLSEASSALIATRGRRLTVLVSESIWSSCTKIEKSFVWENIEVFGARLYFISAVDF